jgi:hypothetical protein
MMILLICLRFIFLRSRVTTTQKIFRQLESGLQGYFLAVLRRIQPRFFISLKVIQKYKQHLKRQGLSL